MLAVGAKRVSCGHELGGDEEVRRVLLVAAKESGGVEVLVVGSFVRSTGTEVEGVVVGSVVVTTGALHGRVR